jgi:hypothetical protein
MTPTEQRQLAEDIKEMKRISARIEKLSAKHDLVKYNSNYNLLVNSFEHVTSILEDISNEN